MLLKNTKSRPRAALDAEANRKIGMKGAKLDEAYHFLLRHVANASPPDPVPKVNMRLDLLHFIRSPSEMPPLHTNWRPGKLEARIMPPSLLPRSS